MYTWCHKLYAKKDTLRKHSKKIHQFTNGEFETVEIHQEKKEPIKDINPPKTTYTTSTPKFRITPGTKKWLQKPKVTKEENIHLFDIPEPISPIYEPCRLKDTNTTVLQDEIGQFSQENEQIINIYSMYNIFLINNKCKCHQQIWNIAN
jgi:hypothetical protein